MKHVYFMLCLLLHPWNTLFAAAMDMHSWYNLFVLCHL